MTQRKPCFLRCTATWWRSSSSPSGTYIERKFVGLITWTEWARYKRYMMVLTAHPFDRERHQAKVMRQILPLGAYGWKTFWTYMVEKSLAWRKSWTSTLPLVWGDTKHQPNGSYVSWVWSSVSTSQWESFVIITSSSALMPRSDCSRVFQWAKNAVRFQLYVRG